MTPAVRLCRAYETGVALDANILFQCWDGQELVQDRTGAFGGVVEVENHEDVNEVLDRVVRRHDNGGFGVIIVGRQVADGVDERILGFFAVYFGSTPNLAYRNRLEDKIRDDEKLVSTSFQCVEKVGVRGAVRVKDSAVGSDALKVDDVVAGEALLPSTRVSYPLSWVFQLTYSVLRKDNPPPRVYPATPTSPKPRLDAITQYYRA